MRNFLLQWLKELFSCLGVFWMLLKFVEHFFAIAWFSSKELFIIIIVFSLGYSIYKARPWTPIRVKISGSDVFISIHFSDILKEDGNIVIPSNNTFTTDLRVMSEKTLLGQFLLQKMSGNNSKMDEGIENSLRGLQTYPAKGRKGKPNAYPIGTVAVFETANGKKGFLLSLTEIVDEDSSTRIVAETEYLLKGLDELWKKVAVEIHDEPLDITPVGAGISHLFSRTLDAIIFTALDFARQSRIKRPCSELRIFVRKDHLTFDDYTILKQGLNAIVS
jgi:hypothetical protein